MAYSYADIFQSEAERIDAEAAAAVAELEAGRVAEDADRVRWASKQVLALDAERNNLVARANAYARPAQAPRQVNRNGLSPEEADAAKISGISEEEYFRNRQKMQAMKDQGYWSQGKVFK